jgi:hypothetical protein
MTGLRKMIAKLAGRCGRQGSSATSPIRSERSKDTFCVISATTSFEPHEANRCLRTAKTSSPSNRNRFELFVKMITARHCRERGGARRKLQKLSTEKLHGVPP